MFLCWRKFGLISNFQFEERKMSASLLLSYSFFYLKQLPLRKNERMQGDTKREALKENPTHGKGSNCAK